MSVSLCSTPAHHVAAGKAAPTAPKPAETSATGFADLMASVDVARGEPTSANADAAGGEEGDKEKGHVAPHSGTDQTPPPTTAMLHAAARHESAPSRPIAHVDDGTGTLQIRNPAHPVGCNPTPRGSLAALTGNRGQAPDPSHAAASGNRENGAVIALANGSPPMPAEASDAAEPPRSDQQPRSATASDAGTAQSPERDTATLLASPKLFANAWTGTGTSPATPPRSMAMAAVSPSTGAKIQNFPANVAADAAETVPKGTPGTAAQNPVVPFGVTGSAERARPADPASATLQGIFSVADAATAVTSPSTEVHLGHVASHPTGAAFPTELAAEVQVLLTKGGLQKAELQLNPVELGPIRIELSLVAQTADISFSAASAQTRDGIGQSLPHLADMLREQGLSLGQTHVGADTSRPGSDGRWSPAPPALAHDTDTRDASHATTTWSTRPTTERRLPRGVLDLYA